MWKSRHLKAIQYFYRSSLSTQSIEHRMAGKLPASSLSSNWAVVLSMEKEHTTTYGIVQ